MGAEFASPYDNLSIDGRTFDVALTGAPMLVSLADYSFEVGPNCYGCSLKPSFDALLDVTIGGSSAHLRAGEAILMAGGALDVFQANEKFLRKLSQKIFHCGPPGAGAKMKLVFNLVLGLNRAALAEGLAFAERSGLPLEQTLEILQAGPAASSIMERKGPKMLNREYAPEARLAQHHKDVGLILAAAAKSQIHLPLTQAHDRILAIAEALGFAESDNSALIEAYRSDTVNGR